MTDRLEIPLTGYVPVVLAEIDALQPGIPEDFRTMPPSRHPLTPALDVPVLAPKFIQDPACPGNAATDSLNPAQNTRDVRYLTPHPGPTIARRVPPRLVIPRVPRHANTLPMITDTSLPPDETQ